MKNNQLHFKQVSLEFRASISNFISNSCKIYISPITLQSLEKTKKKCSFIKFQIGFKSYYLSSHHNLGLFVFSITTIINFQLLLPFKCSYLSAVEIPQDVYFLIVEASCFFKWVLLIREDVICHPIECKVK